MKGIFAIVLTLLLLLHVASGRKIYEDEVMGQPAKICGKEYSMGKCNDMNCDGFCKIVYGVEASGRCDVLQTNCICQHPC